MGFFDLFKKKDKSKNKKYKMGLHKTREGALATLKEVLSRSSTINDDLFDELEEIFIMADIGVDTVVDFIDELRDEVYNKKISDPLLLQEMIMDKMFEIYLNGEIVNANLKLKKEGLSVVLFVGVNGVGKTTSIAKIAAKEKDAGKKVLLVAADTFRAGAVKQLEEWANRLDVGFYGNEEQKDPASVVYDGLKIAKDDNYDIVLIDTAGRLQNKVNLMKELEKINKIITSFIPSAPHDTLLVIDATTGQNGISQAKTFKEVTDITGIILTKLDGTAKGGIVLAIKEEVDIPVKYVGLGETKDDLAVFDIEKYIYGLFKDMM